MKTHAPSPTFHFPSISAAGKWSRQLLRVLSAAALLGGGVGSVQAQDTTADGTLDTSFNTGSGPNGAVLSIAVQSDGKTIIGGTFTTVDGVASNGVARLNADGSLDTTFNSGTGSNGQVDFVTVLSNGEILVTGTFSTFNGNARANIVRLTASGGVDTSFVPNLQTAGTFAVSAAVVQSDGKVVVPGSITASGSVLLVRLGVGGGIDSTFDFGTGANGTISALALQSDGKIVVGGSFSSINGVVINAIARINANGSVDTTFNPGTGAGGPVQAVAIQSNGEIVIAGSFAEVNGAPRYSIARLNADGTLDGSFIPTGSEDEISSIDAVAIQSNGDVIFGGNFETANNDFESPFIARVLSDGTLETNFTINIEHAAPDSTVQAIVIPPAGQLLIGGTFTTIGTVPINSIARLNDSVHPAFFNGEVSLGSGVYYLAVSDGYNFGEYSYLTDPSYIYSYGPDGLASYEYLIDSNDDENGIYLYDFASSTFFYTSPYFPYPYLYDFTLNSVLYYFQGTSPRSFYDYAAGQYITK